MNRAQKDALNRILEDMQHDIKPKKQKHIKYQSRYTDEEVFDFIANVMDMEMWWYLNACKDVYEFDKELEMCMNILYDQEKE